MILLKMPQLAHVIALSVQEKEYFIILIQNKNGASVNSRKKGEQAKRGRERE